MMSPTLREGIQDLRPGPMGVGVGVGVGLAEGTPPTPLQRFQQDLQQSARMREQLEEGDEGAEAQRQEEQPSAAVAMAAEVLMEEEEEEEEAPAVAAPAPAAEAPAVMPRPPAVPEEKEEEMEEEAATPEASKEEAAGDEAADVSPQTLARAMQQEAIRIDQEIAPTPVPDVMTVFLPSAAAPVAEEEAPAAERERAVEEQDENGGNYLGNNSTSNDSVDVSAPLPSSSDAVKPHGGSGKRVSFSAEECVVIEPPPAALKEEEEEEEEEEHGQGEELELEPAPEALVEEEAEQEAQEEEEEEAGLEEEEAGLEGEGEEGLVVDEAYDADMEEVVGEEEEEEAEQEVVMYEEEAAAAVAELVIEEAKWEEEEEEADAPASASSPLVAPAARRAHATASGKKDSGGPFSSASRRQLFLATTLAVAVSVLLGTAVVRKQHGSGGVRDHQHQHQPPLPLEGGWDTGDMGGVFGGGREEAGVPFFQPGQGGLVAPFEEEAAPAKMPTPSIFQKRKGEQEEEQQGAAAETATGTRWPFLGVVKQQQAQEGQRQVSVRPASQPGATEAEAEAALQLVRVPRRSKFWGRVGEVVHRSMTFRLFGVLLALGMALLTLV